MKMPGKQRTFKKLVKKCPSYPAREQPLYQCVRPLVAPSHCWNHLPKFACLSCVDQPCFPFSCLAIRWRAWICHEQRISVSTPPQPWLDWSPGREASLHVHTVPAWPPCRRASGQMLAEWVRKPENVDTEWDWLDGERWVPVIQCIRCLKSIKSLETTTWIIIYSITVCNQGSGS